MPDSLQIEPHHKINGRPTKYRPDFDNTAHKMCLLGATDVKLADLFDVNVDTIYEWKVVHPSFSEAIKNGRDVADCEIAQALYHRAKGYSHPEDVIFNDKGSPLIVPTIKHYPPDTAAAFIWLKNRHPNWWRDKTEVSITGQLGVVTASVEDLRSELLKLGAIRPDGKLVSGRDQKQIGDKRE